MLDYPIDQNKVPEQIRQILARLDEHGFETWLVGGCVRDLCLGLLPKDFDLATNARPDQVQSIFSHHFATGLQHGTVTVLWREFAVEITTFRLESAYSDSRRPDLVTFHDQIEMDLARRDFTMNSMAWRPDRGLLDLHGGLTDLRQGLLRSVGDPQARFDEDALRMLRAIRFTVTYDLTPSPDLIGAATQMAYRLGRLSRERITSEIQRIMGAPYPWQLQAFAGCGLMSAVVRMLLLFPVDDHLICQRLSRLIQPQLHPDQRLPLFFLTAAAPEFEIKALRHILQPYFLAGAGHRLVRLLMQECRVSRQRAQTSEAILYLIYLRLVLSKSRSLDSENQRRLLRLLARHCHLGLAQINPVIAAANQLLQLCLPETFTGQVNSQLLFESLTNNPPPLTLAELAVNGRQLQAAGFPAGPVLRMLLERLLSRVIKTPEINKLPLLLDLAEKLNMPKNRNGFMV